MCCISKGVIAERPQLEDLAGGGGEEVEGLRHHVAAVLRDQRRRDVREPPGGPEG